MSASQPSSVATSGWLVVNEDLVQNSMSDTSILLLLNFSYDSVFIVVLVCFPTSDILHQTQSTLTTPSM